MLYECQIEDCTFVASQLLDMYKHNRYCVRSKHGRDKKSKSMRDSEKKTSIFVNDEFAPPDISTSASLSTINESKQNLSEESISSLYPQIQWSWTEDGEQHYVKLMDRYYHTIFEMSSTQVQTLLKSKSLAEYKNFIKSLGSLDEKRIDLLDFYFQAKTTGLSAMQAQSWLNFHLSKNKNCELPKTWETINSTIQMPFRNLATYGSSMFPFPKHWNPENERFPFKQGKGIDLRTLDPLEQICTALNDPTVMFSNESIRLEAYCIQNADGEHISVDVMSSPWALHTQNKIRMRDPDGIMLVIIPYSDGLNVTHCINTTFTPVVVTLGNYSNSFFLTNKAKHILGYLPEMEETMLLSYLKNVISMTDSVAKKEITDFKLRVDRAFWVSILSSIQAAGENGVLMPILGLGARRIYPVIPFSIGDEPAQKSHLSLYNSTSCLMACTLCTIPTGNGFKLYDDTLHLKRNRENIRLAALLAETIPRRKQKREKSSSRVKAAVQYCQEHSIHCLRNPFADVQMGALENSIYDSPPCFLHTFIGGPVTYAVYWTLITLAELQTIYPTFKRVVSQADSFIRSFKMNVKWPHLPDQTFGSGLFLLVKDMKLKQKEGISYRKGGYRTSDAVAMNMQLLLALVSVLPSDKNHEHGTNNEQFCKTNKQIFDIIIGALYSTLHAYFSLRKTDWLLMKDVAHLNDELKGLTSSLMELYQLKQTSIKSTKEQFNSSKLHRICHYAYYISRFGPPCRFDTASLETNHIVVKNSFRQSSKRKSTSNLEMTCKISENVVTAFLQTIHSCVTESGSISGCKESTRVDDDEDVVCFIVSRNQKRHLVTAEGDFYLCRTLQLKFGLSESQWRSHHEIRSSVDLTYFLVDYIKISAPVSTKMNGMVLHGNYAAGINDFIEIQTESDESDIAQIVSILCEEEKGQADLDIKVLVKYLSKDDLPSKYKLMPAVALYQSTHKFSLIDCSMIKRPAFIVKIASSKKGEDRFLEFPWEFFDRTGWYSTSERKGTLISLPELSPYPSVNLKTERTLTFTEDSSEDITFRKRLRQQWNYLDPPSDMKILEKYKRKLGAEFTDVEENKRFQICRICIEEVSKELYFEYFNRKQYESRPQNVKEIEHTKCEILIKARWVVWEANTTNNCQSRAIRSASKRNKIIHSDISHPTAASQGIASIDRRTCVGSSRSNDDVNSMTRTQSEAQAESTSNSYEELRRRNIAKNESFLNELNLTSIALLAGRKEGGKEERKEGRMEGRKEESKKRRNEGI